MSDNVRVFTAAQGTSPGAVALRLGRSRQWVQAKLAGRNRWSMEDVEEMAAALGVDPFVLMSTDWWPEPLVRARRDSNPKPSDLEAGGMNVCPVWNDSHDCGRPAGHTGDHVCAGCGDRWNQAPWDVEDSEEFAWQRDDERCVDQ